MIKTIIAISLVAMTSAVAGQLTMAERVSGDAEVTEQSFMSPRVEGRRLDVRFDGAEPRQPVDTARQFCLSRGFDDVVGYSIQPASSTRTISDLEPHTSTYGQLRAFYAIRCAAGSQMTTAS